MSATLNEEKTGNKSVHLSGCRKKTRTGRLEHFAMQNRIAEQEIIYCCSMVEMFLFLKSNELTVLRYLTNCLPFATILFSFARLLLRVADRSGISLALRCGAEEAPNAVITANGEMKRKPYYGISDPTGSVKVLFPSWFPRGWVKVIFKSLHWVGR